MMKRRITLLLFVGLFAILAIAGCGGSDDSDNAEKDTSSGNDKESSNYSEELDYAITGIEPGAGVFKAAERAIEEYDNLDGWEVKASSSGAMAASLGEAIENEEPIIVTGWSPHWKFAKYDLHYLEDPKNSFGQEQYIATMARKGLKEDMPNAYKVLDQFKWTSEDLENVMLEITNGADPEDAAAKWVKENEDKVSEWTKGTEKVDGKSVELAYVEWDTEIGSTNVVKKVLEDLGFDVTITPLDNAVMWQAVATGDADGMVAAWLPVSQANLYEQHKDDLVDLGKNLEGVKIGLVIPDYMDIDSIEDLKPKE